MMETNHVIFKYCKGVTKAVENVNEIIAPEIIEGEFSVLDKENYLLIK
ncbi:hypothetical protein ACVPOQ_13025 [Staphylococcus aureus]